MPVNLFCRLWSILFRIAYADQGVWYYAKQSGKQYNDYPDTGSGFSFFDVVVYPDSQEYVDKGAYGEYYHVSHGAAGLLAPLTWHIVFALESIFLPIHFASFLFYFKLGHFLLAMDLVFAFRYIQLHVPDIKVLFGVFRSLGERVYWCQ